MATKWQRLSINIPKEFKPKQRENIAGRIIDHITERTVKSGKDKNGKRFVRYTKEYAKKKGVGRGTVDLVDTFEMMTSIQLLSERSGKLIIGFEKGSKVNGKADGNIRGTYGRKSPLPGKARDFLGINLKQLEKIYDKIEQKPATAREDVEAASRSREGRR